MHGVSPGQLGLGLIPSPIKRGDSGVGVLVQIRNTSMHGQKFLCSLRFLEPELTSLLFPSWAMGLFNQIVAVRRGNRLNVLHSVEHGKGSKSHAVAPQLILMNSVWGVRICEQAFKKGLCGMRVTMGACKKTSSVAPVSSTARYSQNFLSPPSTHTSSRNHREPRRPLSVAQFFSQKGGALDVPLAQCFMADLLGRAGAAIPGHRVHSRETGGRAKGRAE
ncbi:hypothetical protein HNQ08_003747 [Deinococcus humi]|uniref:Uncharacterized protein n=1 Tax=Deinococcus humi TaxID=662880 RepID=A0A7W8NER2_9DEIO|nr:hypothetical protein [Deinococcus humi]